MRITTYILFFFLLLCNLDIQAQATSGKADNDKPEGLFKVLSFDNKKQLKNWKKSSGASLEIGAGNWKEAHYGVITFIGPAFNKEDILQKKKNNPNFLNTFKKASEIKSAWVRAPLALLKQKKQSLSEYERLRFTTYNPSNRKLSYNVNLKDETSKERAIPYFVTLEPHEEKQIEIDLKKTPYLPKVDFINRYISTDNKNVNQIEFAIPYHLNEAQFYISDIELLKTPQEKGENTVDTPSPTNTDKNAFSLLGRSSLDKVFIEKERFDVSLPDENKLFSAKNEREGMQVVILPHSTDLNNLKWSIDDFKDNKGNSIPVSISVVGYVDVTKQPRYHIDHLGWYPDPLIDSISSISRIPKSEVLTLFLRADIPKNATPGNYKTTLSVQSTEATIEKNIELEVWNFTLPERSHNTFIGQFYRLNSMSQFMPPKDPEKTFKKRAQKETQIFEDWLLKYRIQPGNIYSYGPPNWDEKRLKSLAEKGLNAINLGYVRIDRKKADKYNEKEHWDRVKKQVESIKKYIPTLKNSGVWDDPNIRKFIFLFDEWPGNKSNIVYETAKYLKKELPDIELVTTMSDRKYGLGEKNGNLIDLWVPHVNVLQENKLFIDNLKSIGKEFGWYFAIGSYAPYPNFWLENNFIDSRISLGALSYKYDSSFFIYWALNRWFNNRPTSFGKDPKTKWKAASYGTGAKNLANGEGSLFYARKSKNKELGSYPMSSLRLENIRDGLEDYEYYKILDNLYKENNIQKQIIDNSVLENVGDYTQDPVLFNKKRVEIAKEILRLSKK